jgi:hypothetical protein
MITMNARQPIQGWYGPEALKVIGQAFDETWGLIAGNFVNDVDIEKARNRLARVLLSVADDDSRDVSVLRQAALQRISLDYKRRETVVT